MVGGVNQQSTSIKIMNTNLTAMTFSELLEMYHSLNVTLGKIEKRADEAKRKLALGRKVHGADKLLHNASHTQKLLCDVCRELASR
jgi:hypothetical protein